MPTVQEILAAARAAKAAGAYAPQPSSAAPQEDFSLTGAAKELGAFGLNALGVVGNTLDLLPSMGRDVVRTVTSGTFQNPFDQLLTPFTDENRATGRQILEDLGMRKNRETGMGGWLKDPGEGARDVSGFVLEVLLDPFGPVGKAIKAPQAITKGFKAAGRAGAAGVRRLPGGTQALQVGEDALAVANRLRKKYFDRSVGGASSPVGQGQIAHLNKASDVVNNESLRFTVDASQLAEDIGWSVRGEVPDILEKQGAIARYLARADMRTVSPVLEQDLVRDVAGQFPKDMTVRGIRLGADDVRYALLEGLPDHVRFPVDQLQVVGDSLQTVPERLMPVLDEMRTRAAQNLERAQHAGVDVAKHYDENGHEFFHQYMLDAQQHAILRQGGGLVHGHRSAALKIAAGQPEARDALFQSKGTVHGPSGLADIFKEPVWDDVVREFSDLNESFAPDLRIKDMDGQAVMVLPDHVGFRHIEKFADKVGMEPIDLWRKLGLDPEKGWAKVDDVEKALNTFKGQLDEEARASGAGNASVYFGNQMFRNILEGKNTAVKLVDPKDLTAGHILPNGQTMRQIADPKAELESLAKGIGDKDVAERLIKEADSWGNKPMYEWYIEGQRRLFTPDVHTDLAKRFKDNLGKLRKAAKDSPVDQVAGIADTYQLLFKSRYSHLINGKMPFFDADGLLVFTDNMPGPKAGSPVKMPLKEFTASEEEYEVLKKSLEEATDPQVIDELQARMAKNFAARLEAGQFTQKTVNRHQGLAELLRDRENFREFGGFGNNPFVDHHEGTVKLNRSIQTAQLLQRFVANSLANELATRRSSQNYSRVRLAGDTATGLRVEEMMKNMPGLKMDVWMERTFEQLKAMKAYAGELTPGIRNEILQHTVDPAVVKEFQDAFKLMNEVPVISDPLKWWDSLSNVMKSGLLATPSRINRDTFSSLVMGWTKGLLGIRDAKHIKNGLALMRGKSIDWAPDTDEIRAMVKLAGGDPNQVSERLRVFKTLWASRSGHGGMHDVLSGDVFARETSGQADRLLDIVPGARGEGIAAQIKRDLKGQSLGQKANVVTNVAGTWYRDETGNWVQRSTNNALASISNRVSNVFDKGIKLGTMMAVLEKAGKGAKFDDAYKQVSKALLNYQSKDFSQFERLVLKRIFPFYGFMSRSVAMVAGELATNPGGRLAQTIRAQRSMQDSEGYTPYELQDTAAVPLGTDAENNLRFLTGFGLMHEDAMQYLAPTQGYRGILQKLLGSANPVLKQPIEYALNTSTFFEGPMGGRRLDDLDPTMGRLKQLIGERIGLVGPLQPGQSPKPIGGSAVESMVASSPAAAWLRMARTSLDPRKGTTEKLLNILSGVRTKTMSPEAQIREIRDRINAVEIEMGARPLTLTVGNKKLEARARAEGDNIKADRLKAARKVLEHIRKASEK